MAFHKRQLGYFAALLFIYIGVFWVYQHAQGLTWQFDDKPNLRNLAAVSSLSGLLDFVFTGVAGPTGRPISLLTFVANYDDMPNNPWGFVRLTYLLHAINSALIFLISLKLLETQREFYSCRYTLAFIVAVLWLILPIHASGTLMPVQRMTHVSAFFVFFTLYIYLSLRLRKQTTEHQLKSYFLPAFAIIIGCVLATYSKENGVVVVTLIGLVELFWIANNYRHTFITKLWIWACLLTIPVFMAYYFVSHYNGISNSFAYYRGLSLSEHLATQAVISWDYVKQTLIPRSALMGPYHDGHVHYSWQNIAPWLAVISWLALLFGTGYLGFKRKSLTAKIIMFGALFFLAAHQIESTFIPLELYFEHRNYIASFGLVVALVLTTHLLIKSKRLIFKLTIPIGFASFLLFNLIQITTLWGQPLLAAEMWHRYHPNSARATQLLADYYRRYDFDTAAHQLLTEFSLAHNNVGVGIQALIVQCQYYDIIKQKEDVLDIDALTNMIPYQRSPIGLNTSIAVLGNQIRNDKCPKITSKQYIALLEAIISSPIVEKSPRIRHHFLFRSEEH